MRIMSKDLLHNNVGGAKDEKGARACFPWHRGEEVADASPTADSKAVVPSLSKKANKPAWAMTEDKAGGLADGKEEEDLFAGMRKMTKSC